MATLLIVDDSVDTREFCELIGKMFSMRVHQALNADDAIKQVDGGLIPDLILLDLMMPGSPPQIFVERLKSDIRLKNSKIVIMSAIREVNGVAREMGADGSLRKPFDMAAFVDTLRRYSLTGPQEEILAASSL